jgi:hypothetical protein
VVVRARWATRRAKTPHDPIVSVTKLAGLMAPSPVYRRTNAEIALAMPCAAASRQCGSVTLTASLALRMLAHSMKIFGTVDRLRPARSLRGWMPFAPRYKASFQQAAPVDGLRLRVASGRGVVVVTRHRVTPPSG